MKLDAHPKSMAFIMFCLGLCIMGIILLAAFFDDSTMLGVGIAMAILGIAGAIVGCIHRTTKGEYGRSSRGDDKAAAEGVAPERIPSPSIVIDRDRSFEGDGNQLYYPPCSVSPPRPHRNADGMLTSPPGGAIVPMDYNGADGGTFMSPFAERTFPVPMSPSGQPVNRNAVGGTFVVPKEWDTPMRRQPSPQFGSANRGGDGANGQYSPSHQ